MEAFLKTGKIGASSGESSKSKTQNNKSVPWVESSDEVFLFLAYLQLGLSNPSSSSLFISCFLDHLDLLSCGMELCLGNALYRLSVVLILYLNLVIILFFDPSCARDCLCVKNNWWLEGGSIPVCLSVSSN